MTRIVPGYVRGETPVRPGNPTLEWSAIPPSQQGDAPRIEYDEPHDAYYCSRDKFWKREVRPCPEQFVREANHQAAIPVSDPSGPMWSVVDRKTKAVLWRFRAGTFDRALSEKRRLCAIAGGKSGYCFLSQDKPA